MANDVVRSTSSFRNYIWIPIPISFLLCVRGSAEAQGILLPSQRHSAPNPNLYYRPVIGIVAHPGDGASGRLSNATTASYIAASYVKFVESGGARVIPLIFNEPSETLLKVCVSVMDSNNGPTRGRPNRRTPGGKPPASQALRQPPHKVP
ncbi:hypothetical protein K1719_034576 [Acacia pycnantha]|nr:hypothetical protein K1719_034576 [Acacia pycnantha]